MIRKILRGILLPFYVVLVAYLAIWIIIIYPFYKINNRGKGLVWRDYLYSGLWDSNIIDSIYSFIFDK